MSEALDRTANERLTEAMGLQPGTRWDDSILMLNASVEIRRLQSENQNLRGALVNLELSAQEVCDADLFHTSLLDRLHEAVVEARAARVAEEVWDV